MAVSLLFFTSRMKICMQETLIFFCSSPSLNNSHFKIGGRAYLAQTRHRAGYRRVTKIFAASVEALHADGLAAAQALSGEWVRLEPVKSPAEGVTLDRWLFSGDTAAWYHRRQRRRAQERSEGTEMHKEEATAAAPNHGPLAVHLLYAAAARRLVAELIDGDPAAFSAWLLNIVPRISHLEMKDGSAMAEAS